MIAFVLTMQLCAVAPAGGVVATEGRGGSAHAIAAGPGGVAVTWIEARRPDRSFSGPSGARQHHAVARAFAPGTLAPAGPARVVDVQSAGDAFQNGAAPVALPDGGLQVAACQWMAFAGRMHCGFVPLAGQAPRGGDWTFALAAQGPTDRRMAATAVGNVPVLAVPRRDARLYVLAAGARRRDFAVDQTEAVPADDAPRGDGPGPLDAPALAPAGSDQAVVAWRLRDGVFARLVGTDGRARGRVTPLSEGGGAVGAPSVAWSGDAALVAYAARRRSRDPWRLVLARWAPGSAPTRTALVTGDLPATAPSLAATTRGCAVLSWTEGRGRETVARAGRVCQGALVAGSVATLSTAGAEAGDSEVAWDGRDAYVAWQEAPRGGRAELRVGRLGCR